MSWEVTTHFDDAEAKGLGMSQQPEMGAYVVRCGVSEYRAPRTNANGEKAIYLPLTVESDGPSKGRRATARVQIVDPALWQRKLGGDEKARRAVAARTAEGRAAVRSFNPEKAAQIEGILNTPLKLASAYFDGKVGHIWFEPGIEGDDTSYPAYRFLTREQYEQVMKGEFVPRRVNIPRNDTTQTGEATLGTPPSTLGTPPATLGTPPNGGGDVILPGAAAAAQTTASVASLMD